jgi:hypothetical protein
LHCKYSTCSASTPAVLPVRQALSSPPANQAWPLAAANSGVITSGLQRSAAHRERASSIHAASIFFPSSRLASPRVTTTVRKFRSPDTLVPVPVPPARCQIHNQRHILDPKLCPSPAHPLPRFALALALDDSARHRQVQGNRPIPAAAPCFTRQTKFHLPPSLVLPLPLPAAATAVPIPHARVIRELLAIDRSRKREFSRQLRGLLFAYS